MAARVTDQEVRGIIETDADLSMAPFIAAANALTDWLDSEDTDGLLTDALLIEIERYLAAHFYAIRDQQYRQKRTGNASGIFQVGAPGTGRLELNDWGRAAMTLDITGILTSLNRGQRFKVTVDWIGLPKSEQTAYQDRD